jgi:hypothetical protein
MTRRSLQDFAKLKRIDTSNQKLINSYLVKGYVIISKPERVWDAKAEKHFIYVFLGLPGSMLKKDENGVYVYE